MSSDSKPSRSRFLQVRGLRYHVRCWGPDHGRPLLLLHGWMDVSACWQFMVDALPDRRILAPDFRGFGLTQWAPDTYWFPDYVADLDAIVGELVDDDQTIDLVGHSMGSQIASLYAGLRNERVRRLIGLDGFYLSPVDESVAPLRYLSWLNNVARQPEGRSYASFEEFAKRMARRHPCLSAEQVDMVAGWLGEESPSGEFRLRADPRHYQHSPQIYRASEAEMIWRRITAPVLCLDAGNSSIAQAGNSEQRDLRLKNFSNLERQCIDGVGHMLQFEAPEATARAIADFLAPSP